MSSSRKARAFHKFLLDPIPSQVQDFGPVIFVDSLYFTPSQVMTASP